MAEISTRKTLTNAWFYFFATLAAAVGIVLLLVSAQMPSGAWQAVVRDLGALSVVSVALTLIWELFGRRQFIGEILEGRELADNVIRAGLLNVSLDYLEGVSWTRLINESRRLDVFASYARTWTNARTEDLRRFLQRSDVSFRFLFPDPKDSELMVSLGRRFGKTPENVAAQIHEVVRLLCEDILPHKHASARAEIWFQPRQPLYTAYLFDRKAVVTLFRHGGRGNVPVFVFGPGTVFDHLDSDIRALIEGDTPVGRRVYPEA